MLEWPDPKAGALPKLSLDYALFTDLKATLLEVLCYWLAIGVASLTEVVEIVTLFSKAGSGCEDFGVISIA